MSSLEQSQWTVLMGYFTISANVRRYQIHHRWHIFLSGRQRTGALCVAQSNWVKMWFSCFPVLPGSAETQVIWGGIVKRFLVAYFMGNISAKKYQNPFMCIKVIASQRWDVFWDTVYNNQVPVQRKLHFNGCRLTSLPSQPEILVCRFHPQDMISLPLYRCRFLALGRNTYSSPTVSRTSLLTYLQTDTRSKRKEKFDTEKNDLIVKTEPRIIKREMRGRTQR